MRSISYVPGCQVAFLLKPKKEHVDGCGRVVHGRFDSRELLIWLSFSTPSLSPKADEDQSRGCQRSSRKRILIQLWQSTAHGYLSTRRPLSHPSRPALSLTALRRASCAVGEPCLALLLVRSLRFAPLTHRWGTGEPIPPRTTAQPQASAQQTHRLFPRDDAPPTIETTTTPLQHCPT